MVVVVTQASRSLGEKRIATPRTPTAPKPRDLLPSRDPPQSRDSSHDPLGASTPLRVSIHLPGVRKTRTQEGAVCTKGGEAKETFTQGKFM